MEALKKLKEIRDEFINELTELYSLREAENIFFYSLHVLEKKDRKALIFDEQTKVSKQYEQILRALIEGKPIQYILKRASFFDMDLFVNESVLIPRPETEELVQWVVDEVSSKDKSIIDIGTGSGCIAISLKKQLDNTDILACDISAEALNVAIRNAEEQGVYIKHLQLDALKEELPKVNIIVSNPPYIPQRERIEMLQRVVDHEPELALFIDDNDPLIFYRSLIAHGAKQGAKVYFEIHEEMKEELEQLVKSFGYTFEFRKDLQNKYRMLKIEI